MDPDTGRLTGLIAGLHETRLTPIHYPPNTTASGIS